MDKIYNELTFRTLLYRYMFYEWLFRDCSSGNIFEKAAAWRHNQENAKWLPLYMKRWTILGFLLIFLGFLFEHSQMHIVAAFFYVPGVLAFPINTVISVSWLGLKLMPPPY